MSDRHRILDQQRELVEAALAAGRQIIVAGGIDTNLSKKFRDHPKIDHWTRDEVKRRATHKSVPKNAGVLLFFRFVDHPVINTLAKIAAKHGVPCTKRVIETGEIDYILAPVIEPVPSKEPSVPLHPAFGPISASPARGTRSGPPPRRAGRGTTMPAAPLPPEPSTATPTPEPVATFELDSSTSAPVEPVESTSSLVAAPAAPPNPIDNDAVLGMIDEIGRVVGDMRESLNRFTSNMMLSLDLVAHELQNIRAEVHTDVKTRDALRKMRDMLNNLPKGL